MNNICDAIDFESVKPKTKTEKVMAHLMIFGSITSLDAIKLYGATRLSAIIFTLKNEMKIERIPIECTDNFGNTAKYVKYCYLGEV